MIKVSSHSTASSNQQTMVKHPRSICEKITSLDDALQLFDEMTQRQPLPPVIKFNELLQVVAKIRHYSCSIELFKQMNLLRVLVDAYTINIVMKCCCQMHRMNEGFVVLGLASNMIYYRIFGNNDTTIALLKLMEGRGCKPDMVEMLLLEMEGRGFSVNASTVSLLLDHIKARSLDASLLKLIGKLVPKEEVDIPCFRV
ncbi:unnamed protein product [Lactuca virosa]|uniref:Pentatricopeptide repeat-containing protein n=1 Tax=Lactuca virosa TaxID=75947 RepID=A0AAU9LVD6_9ASTR|nr:unnamed protein product [Lactuca virosa]